MISVRQCHERVAFTGRPPAGTSPFTWWNDCWKRKVRLCLGRNEGDVWAVTQWHAAGPVVVLDYRLTDIQKRVALAHEMHHLAIGGVCATRCPRNERAVVRATARWLVPDVVDLAERLLRGSLTGVAVDLAVYSFILTDRLRYTTPAERRAVDEVMVSRPSWATNTRMASRLLAATT